jgi:hypothetical protein
MSVTKTIKCILAILLLCQVEAAEISRSVGPEWNPNPPAVDTSKYTKYIYNYNFSGGASAEVYLTESVDAWASGSTWEKLEGIKHDGTKVTISEKRTTRFRRFIFNTCSSQYLLNEDTTSTDLNSSSAWTLLGVWGYYYQMSPQTVDFGSSNPLGWVQKGWDYGRKSLTTYCGSVDSKVVPVEGWGSTHSISLEYTNNASGVFVPPSGIDAGIILSGPFSGSSLYPAIVDCKPVGNSFQVDIYVTPVTPGSLIIESSSDLNSWSTLSTISLPGTSALFSYTDSATLGVGTRFYRVKNSMGTYASQIVGFSNIGASANTSPAFQFLACQFNRYPNSVDRLFSNVSNGTEVQLYDSSSNTFVSSIYSSVGGWSKPYLIQQLGRPFWFKSPTNSGLTLFGFVKTGTTSVPVNSTLLPANCPAPKGGQITSLGISTGGSSELDVLIWNVAGQSWSVSSFVDGAWESGSNPVLSVGQGVYIRSTPNQSWVHSLSLP